MGIDHVAASACHMHLSCQSTTRRQGTPGTQRRGTAHYLEAITDHLDDHSPCNLPAMEALARHATALNSHLCLSSPVYR